jgi:hypothetical protein
VQEAIAAGDRIIDTAYSQERNPGMLSTVMGSYDCSGSTDFVLWNAGLGAAQVDVGDAIAGDSAMLERYGDPGAGRWITVFGSSGHAFIESTPPGTRALSRAPPQAARAGNPPRSSPPS